MVATLTQLQNERSFKKASIKRAQVFLDENPLGTPEMDLEACTTRLEMVDLAFKEINTIQQQIMYMSAELDDYKKEEEYYIVVEKMFQTVKSRLTRLINIFKNPVGIAPPGNDLPLPIARSDVRLPALSIPTFSGDLTEWASFSDIFTGTVASNANLTEAQKLQYLKSVLKDEPLQLIRHFSITNVNYTEAWEKLVGRYDKKKHIVNAHIKRLMEQSNVTHPSSSKIRQLLNTSDEAIRALKALECESRDPWIIYVLIHKLDSDTKTLWFQKSVSNDSPTLKDFFDFLDERSYTLESMQGSSNVRPSGTKTSSDPLKVHHSSQEKSTSSTVHNTSKKPQMTTSSSHSRCSVCHEQHPIWRCFTFKKWSIDSRREYAKSNNLCFNCLDKSHLVKDCKRTTSCFQCNNKHHTLLHNPTASEPVTSSSCNPTPTTSSNHQVSSLPASISSFTSSSQHMVDVLPTAVVYAKDISGENQMVRIMIDTGSESCLISEDCVRKLGISRKPVDITLNGLAAKEAGYAKGLSTVELSSRFDENEKITIDCLILDVLTSDIPSNHFKVPDSYRINEIQKLADPEFNKPNKIDIMIGFKKFLLIIGSEKILDLDGAPIAISSMFGFLIAGERELPSREVQVNCVSLDETMKQFWEIEEIQAPVPLTDEEKACETHFKLTHSRTEDGRIMVKIPFKDSPELGNSLPLAVSRLSAMERKFSKDANLKQEYTEFMDKYASAGHMTKIPDEEIHVPVAYYMPHHSVIKVESLSTKLRVVFDASAKSSTGVSLNSTMMVGPTLQDDLSTIILRFRSHKHTFIGDIEKMYRQFLVHPEDRDYQRIVWRNSNNDPIGHYRLNTVTYGTSAAPYLATKSLQKLGEYYSHEYPEAAAVIKRDFYVDDLVSGHNDLDQCIRLQKEVSQILEYGGLHLRKWASNTAEVISQIPENHRITDLVDLTESLEIKTLGIYWKPTQDHFSFKINLSDVQQFTKRTLLSDVSKMFDPLGWLAPAVVVCKILFQKLWLIKLAWDDPLPADIVGQWMAIRSGLVDLERIKIKRWLPNFNGKIQLHGFCDASENAYGATIYSRSCDESNIPHVNFVTAKTKVAPLKQLSVPRLELCGALLLIRLMDSIKSSFLHLEVQCFCYTDSMIVLNWISSPPRRWQTFIANRTSEIISSYPPKHWNHIESKNNPADVASRGVAPKDLLDCALWWEGPSFLREDESSWKKTEIKLKDDMNCLLEEKPIKVKVLQCKVVDDSPELLDKYSSYQKLIRVTAWILRFINNCRLLNAKHTSFLSTSELQASARVYIKWTQQNVYPTEVDLCSSKKPLPSRSPLIPLYPFVDDHVIMRVGGRLKNAGLPYDSTHPIILPGKSQFTTLLITDAHIKLLHAGPELLSSALSQKYWIVGKRSIIKQIVNKCMTCFRQKSEVSKQLMGDLPQVRVTPARPFLNTGVDYAGPFLLKRAKGRSNVLDKSYVSLFVCMATKAIHLELANDLSTNSFLACFKRFIARRGFCTDVYCDNGTNFVGAKRELDELLELTKSQQHQEVISTFSSTVGTTWHFNPPSAPHFGGIWESSVKSMKFHLKRVVGQQHLTFEELSTILTEIEAVLNSRPLYALSSDPQSFEALTPAHFLIGESLMTTPEPDMAPLQLNRMNRFQLIKQLSRDFWNRWRKDYISTLQQRNKWNQVECNLKINDLVVVKDENLPPTQWALGRIIQVLPGKDGKVRVVELICKSKRMLRPIHKLCRLPVE